jgi:hypothetical protein
MNRLSGNADVPTEADFLNTLLSLEPEIEASLAVQEMPSGDFTEVVSWRTLGALKCPTEAASESPKRTNTPVVGTGHFAPSEWSNSMIS